MTMATLKDPGPIEFDGVIEGNDSGGYWVDFPYDLKETFGKGQWVPVSVTYDKKISRNIKLANMGGQNAMVFLHKATRDELGKQKGDKIHIKVQLDKTEHKIVLANDAKSALKRAGLLEKFQSLAFTHQREYNQWIEEAKKPETRARRIEQTVERLTSSSK